MKLIYSLFLFVSILSFSSCGDQSPLSGNIKNVEEGTTALDIATSISEGLARNVLAAEVAGEVVDPQRPITDSSSLKLLTWNDLEGKSTMWHSSAHLLAEALESMFDGIKFWVGPPIEFGFYYDVDFGELSFSEKDLAAVEDKMLEIARGKHTFSLRSTTKKEALEKKCKHSSDMEGLAANAERESIKYMQIKFMEDHQDQEFIGVISGVTEWGMYVEIIENKCEGMVRIRDIKGDYYAFDPKNYAVVGERKKQVYTLGDTVVVMVKNTDLEKRHLDFSLIGKHLTQDTL